MTQLRDTIRVDPSRFAEPLEKVVLEFARENYEGIIDRDHGLIISVSSVDEIGIGKLIPGDGASYHEVIFTVLAYKPDVKEIIDGEVVETTDFGIFVRLGCIDGLVHLSQVADDFFSYDARQSALIGKESGRLIKTQDKVRARIIAVSLSKSSIRIGLTMRQAGLGLLTWIDEWTEQLEANEE